MIEPSNFIKANSFKDLPNGVADLIERTKMQLFME